MLKLLLKNMKIKSNSKIEGICYYFPNLKELKRKTKNWHIK